MGIVKKIVLKSIKIYQKTLSFDHGYMGKLFPNTRFCKFTPTCSVYGYNAIEEHGVIKGGWMAFKRYLKCNPWSKV
jgi:putative membrane protein insertion efficiency factor